jgi:hypothetical protein
MPKVATPLTDAQIKRAKPKEKEYKLNDGSGLSLRVRVSGTKDWIFRYKHPFEDKRKDISFGVYPKVTLAEARVLSEDARALLKEKIDPKEHRDNENQINKAAHKNNLKYVAQSWLDIKKAKLTEDYANDIWRSLELHIFPDLGTLPISTISAARTIEVIKPVATKGSLETVKRLCQRLNEIMVYAVNTGLLEHNTLSGISSAFVAPQKKHMPTLKPEQLPELMVALSSASIKVVTRCLIEWQLHTMVRPSEAAGARWAEIDFINKL